MDSVLTKELSQNQRAEGIWVYYRKTAKIQKLSKPQISKVLADFEFYKANLTNYLGWHIDTSTCLILFDTRKTKHFLVEPIWYSHQIDQFLKLFVGAKFIDTLSLMRFIAELKPLIIVGSDGKFSASKYKDEKVIFDLSFMKTSTIEVQCTIEIGVIENTIKYFKWTYVKSKSWRIIQ